MKDNLKINCPNCDKQNTWQLENKYKPFCSARCKLIDLGEWASENHKIPGDPINLKQSTEENDDSNEL